MTDAARKYIVPVEDEFDDPDTGLIEALRDSDRPERVLRAAKMARRKVELATGRLKRSSERPKR